MIQGSFLSSLQAIKRSTRVHDRIIRPPTMFWKLDTKVLFAFLAFHRGSWAIISLLMMRKL
jgi:hypothetical protein